MRITSLSRFPHPVLTPDSGDYAQGAFEVSLLVEEKPTTGALSMHYKVELTEPSIRALVEAGVAIAGVFAQCDDTYYRDLLRLSWPEGKLDFAPGLLLNRVVVRPMVWLDSPLPNWNPSGVHPEFSPPISLNKGDVLAIGPELWLSVGQAKLAALESIFELRCSNEGENGVRVDPDAERIVIWAPPKLFENIRLLREQAAGLPVLLNCLYLPAIMEVLDALRSGSEDYSNRRWHRPFTAKCDAKGVDLNEHKSLFEVAQLLLDFPGNDLAALVTDVGGDQ